MQSRAAPYVLTGHISAPQTSVPSQSQPAPPSQQMSPKSIKNKTASTSPSPQWCHSCDTCHSHHHPFIQAISQQETVQIFISTQLLHTWIAAFAWGLNIACSELGSFHIAASNNCCHEQILCFYATLLFSHLPTDHSTPLIMQTTSHYTNCYGNGW